MKFDKSLVSGSTTLLVLSLLRDGEKYGYEMISELERRSDRTFSMNEGTLYPLLHTLENGGYIKGKVREAPSGRERKYYALTRRGEKLLADKAAEWRAFSRAVDAVVGSASPLEAV